MNDNPLGVVVVLCYAVMAGVVIGRAFERREREARELSRRVAWLEVSMHDQPEEANDV